MGKYLILNADDYGLTKGVTDGIVRGLDQGFITDLSFIATNDCFCYAAERLRESSCRTVGAHLTVVDGERPVSLPSDVPLLLRENGRFPVDRNVIVWRLLRHRERMLVQLEREFRAQIERLVGAGFEVSHLDSHQHLHLLPGISGVVLKLAREFGVRYVRRPELRCASRYFVPVAVTSSLLRRQLARNGIPAVRFEGMSDSGSMRYQTLARRIEAVDTGITEIGLHPGIADEETRTRYAHWRFHWDEELDAVCRNSLRDTIERAGVILTDFHGLRDAELSNL